MQGQPMRAWVDLGHPRTMALEVQPGRRNGAFEVLQRRL
jgi:hypothetical protein